MNEDFCYIYGISSYIIYYTYHIYHTTLYLIRNIFGLSDIDMNKQVVINLMCGVLLLFMGKNIHHYGICRKI